jgi:serine/threonine protein kinase
VTSEQRRRVREVFEEAIDVSESALGPWLVARCDDEEVRREVASLLASHSLAGDFLTQPIGDLTSLIQESDPGHAPGQTLGPYRILAEAGRGGMGRVYRAMDTRLNRTVAIKSLPASLAADASSRERLRREARAAAALSHPGICTVHALEEIDGALYLVTEFIEGRTLRDEINAVSRPSPALVIETARQLAGALAGAHAAGVTHRDLKPENVMRTLDGRIKVLDFGLARISELEAQRTDVSAPVPAMMTQPGAVIGTPAYMSPEQLNGQPVDARTDVFACGVLVWEFATGRHPFDAPTAIARAGRVLEASPDPLKHARPDLPEPFSAAIDRCLVKSPAARFASGGELLDALAAVAVAEPAPEPGRSHEHSADRRTAWWRTHHLVMIGLYLAAVGIAWLVKEWHHGLTSAVFIGLGIVAAIAGVLRAHLVFTERTHGVGLERERRRIAPVTMVTDLAIALAVGLEGLLVATTRDVPGVLILGFAVGLALARLVMEPATTHAAFDAAAPRGSAPEP